MKNWYRLLNSYRDKRLCTIFFLGFSSGLPLLLTTSTLGIWLLEEGISKTSIGIFAFMSIPYTVKFLWASCFDVMTIPWLTAWLGRRRGVLLAVQVLLSICIMSMSLITPQLQPLLVALVALLIAFFSASQDIVIDALRTELLEEKLYGSGAAVVVFGYHMGMLVAGACALYCASIMPLSQVYLLMGMLMTIGVIATLFSEEPNNQKAKPHHALAPLVEFFQRSHWVLCVFLVITYKLGDAFLTSMSQLFLLETGFSKIEIANIVKVFGVIATIIGGFIASALIQRLNILSSMLFCGIIHIIFNLSFVLQAHVGYNVELLIITIAAENITGGMTSIALVAYISSQCSLKSTASHYALLSSISAIGRSLLSSSSGYFATILGWKMYFVCTSLLGLPSLFILAFFIKQAAKPALTPVEVRA